MSLIWPPCPQTRRMLPRRCREGQAGNEARQELLLCRKPFLPCANRDLYLRQTGPGRVCARPDALWVEGRLMSLRWLCQGAVVATLLLSGCGWFGSRAKPDEVPEDTTTRLSKEVSVDVSAWLKKPRAELAQLCDKTEADAQTRAKAL